MLKLFLTLTMFALIQSGRGQKEFYISKDPEDVKFHLFPIRGDPAFMQELTYGDRTAIQQTLFQSQFPTVLLVHGFRNNVTTEMPQILKNAYLASDLNYNYIAMDWGLLATPLPPEVTAKYYPEAVANIPIAANRLADMLVFLHKSGFIDPKTVHCLGHSLGAHLCGLAGLYFYRSEGVKIARITGLDPAGPMFYPPTPETNLVPEDADFVDVIHTNAGYRGDDTVDGHVDFWPNGGVSQPGCCEEDAILPDGDAQYVGRCSHWYAFKLYAASITKQFTACECDMNQNFFVRRFCYFTCSNPVQLGYGCPTTARGQYYLETTNPA